jgi:hypothetical protein
VQLMSSNGWKSSALADRANWTAIRSHCTEFVRAVVPEVHLWRCKVAAHYAATDPFHNDNLGTLEQSIMNPVTYKFPYYYVGMFQVHVDGESSQLPTWALTKVYEDLRSRFWPELQLQAVPAGGA